MTISPNPEFAWSVSRAGLFEFCRRKYYHRYYGMWSGWNDDADDQRKLTYLLSKRTSLTEWVGKEVHRAMALYLISEKEMPQILEDAKARMRSQFRVSRSKEFLRPGNVKAFGLVEHYYGDDLKDEDVLEHWNHVEACLNAFAASPYRQDARSAREARRRCFVEKPDSDTDFEAMSFRQEDIGDFRVYARPDFVITNADGCTCIYDWKTGRTQEEGQDSLTKQLAFYVLWCRHKLKDPCFSTLENLEAYEVYWPSQEFRGGKVSQDDLDLSLHYARSSVSEMRSCVEDPEENVGYEPDFEASPSPAKCRLCQFRAVCKDKAI